MSASSSATGSLPKDPSAEQASERVANEPVQSVEEGEEEDDGEEEEEEDTGEPSTQLQPGGTLTAKQRKKKKSKAAQKLKKKLGLQQGQSSQQPQVTEEMLSQVHSAVSQSHGEQAASKVNAKNLEEVLRLMTLEKTATLQGQKDRTESATLNQIKDHKFWKTQPVMKKAISASTEEGPIQPSAPPEKIAQEPYPLPKEFEWVTIDIDDDVEVKEVYELLTANYVEDDDATLRFNYSSAFFSWVLKHPGYTKTWHVGVRASATKKLVAFISGIPHELRVREKSFQSTEINFLCVHKKLRSKRLAPVLIKEVTRRCHLAGIFQAIYTVGSVLPTPFSCARYYHRTINPHKLLDIGFAAVPSGMTKERWAARYKIADQTSTAGLREMQDKDVPAVGKLLRKYLRRFDMAPRFSDEEIRHVLLSGNGSGGSQRVVWTYVVQDEFTGAITDMASFYSLPSSVLNSQKYTTLQAAYLFYYATDAAFPQQSEQGSSSDSSSTAQGAPIAKAMTEEERGLPAWKRGQMTALTQSELNDEEGVIAWDHESAQVKTKLSRRLTSLISDVMVIAKKEGFDVLNTLTTLDNNLFLNSLSFGPGDGFLRWYLYNWNARPIAGGMGHRPGEAELDPAVEAEGASAKLAKKDWTLGSGLGVAMV